MKCPTCNAWAIVKETRPRPDGSTRRRYECANLHRWSTVERVQELPHCPPRGEMRKVVQ